MMSRTVMILLSTGALLAAGQALAADVTAVATMTRGTVLSDGDIEIYPAPEEDPRAVAQDYIGMELKRTVYAGQPITQQHLRQPMLVKRNTMVMMTYRFNGLVITTQGRALDEGSMGEPVEVMNLQSRKKVVAVVTGPDSVDVTG